MVLINRNFIQNKLIDAYTLVQEFIGDVFLETATNYWVFSPTLAYGSRLTTCGKYTLVGGYNKFGANAYVERTFTSLPPHYSARVRFLLLKIDSWDAEDFYITIDTTRIKTERLEWDSDTTLTGNLCGDAGYNEAERTFSEVFSHSATSLKVKLHTNLDKIAADESWGFSNFELVVYRCDASCASCSESLANACTGCNTNAALSSGVCSCNTG